MDPLTPSVNRFTRALAGRDLIIPALLLLTSHRPLAFVTGQLLYLCEPLAALCGQDGVKQWAELLNDPHRLAEFERRWAGPNPAPTEQTPGYDHS